MRRFGEPRKPEIKYTPRPGAYAILLLGRHVLLTHQAVPTPETQLPGGGIDPGESPIRALHREVLEETGYRISIHRRLGAYQRYSYMPDYDLWAQKICHIYLARPTRQIGPPFEPDHEPLWVERESAPEMLSTSGDAAFLRDVLRRL